MREHRIAAIPADGNRTGGDRRRAGGAGRARHPATAAFPSRSTTTIGAASATAGTGALMPADGLDQLRGADAIYFGAVGAPDIPDHITLWGLRLPICQGFDQYANVRPTRILPGVTSPLRHAGPGDLDWLIVRENSEGEYAGHGGRAHRGLPEEVATEVAIFTRVGVERIMPLRLPVRPGTAAQAPDGRHQIQRPTVWHGVSGTRSLPWSPPTSRM